MVKLEKNEKKLFELSFKKRFHGENDMKINRVILTNQFIRIQYITYIYNNKRVKKNKEQLYIDLNSIHILEGYPEIYYKAGFRKVILQILFSNTNIEIELKCKRKKRKCINEINTFIKKTSEALEEYIDCKIANIEPSVNFVEVDKVKKFLIKLGPSITELTPKTIKKLRTDFPIPKEHDIIWANCTFNRICSGVVFTQKGIFIKNNILDENRKIIDVSFHFWRYEYIESPFFELNTEDILKKDLDEIIVNYSNIAYENQMKEELEYIGNFIYNNYFVYKEKLDEFIESDARFIAKHKNQVNTRHGFYAEKYNNTNDIRNGLNAEIIGNLNEKDGADRKIKKFFKTTKIQTKCYKTYKDTIDALFDDNNNFRYFDKNNKLMISEIPRDQFDDAVNYLSCIMLGIEKCDKLKNRDIKIIDFKKFNNKIDKYIFHSDIQKTVDAVNVNLSKELNDKELAELNKQLENVKKQAEKMLIKMDCDYKQYVNMAKAGNIDSLKFDAKNAAVVFTSVFPKTLVLNIANNYRNCDSIKEIFQTSFVSAGQSSVTAFTKQVLVSQFYKTNLPKFFHIEESKQFKNSPVDCLFTIATLSIPNIVETFRKNITYGQLMKNTLVLTGSVVGGVVGAKIGGTIGRRFLWIIGEFFGAIIGGLIGQKQGAKIAKNKADEYREDDIVIFSRLYYAYVEMLVVDYVMDEKEIKQLYDVLKKERPSDLVRLNKQFLNHDCSEKYLLNYITKKIKRIIVNRPKINDYDILNAIEIINT